jgi:hypothetical protein
MAGQHRPELSVTQLIAGAGATVTATVAASYFGVGGTLIGAGAVSVLSTVGATLYQHFLDRGKAQLAAKIPVRAAVRGDDGDRTPPVPTPVPASGRGRPWPKWHVLAGAAGGVFLAVMGLVTAFELATGRPLSNTLQGGTGRGTTFHPIRGHARPAPTPPAYGTVTPDTGPTVTATPSARPSARPARPAAPTPSAGETSQLVPGLGSGPPIEATGAPAPARSAGPQRPLDDEDAGHTP